MKGLSYKLICKMSKKGNYSMIIKTNYKGLKFKYCFGTAQLLSDFDDLDEDMLTEMFASLQNTYGRKISEKIIKTLSEDFGL